MVWWCGIWYDAGWRGHSVCQLGRSSSQQGQQRKQSRGKWTSCNGHWHDNEIPWKWRRQVNRPVETRFVAFARRHFRHPCCSIGVTGHLILGLLGLLAMFFHSRLVRRRLISRPLAVVKSSSHDVSALCEHILLFTSICSCSLIYAAITVYVCSVLLCYSLLITIL